MPKPRLLFISNLFPDESEPYRGLDNATILRHLVERWDIATLAVRPVLPFRGWKWKPRDEDAVLAPRYVRSPYIPKIGHRVNHRLMAGALRRKVAQLRDGFQVALVSWIYPDSCAVAMLASELRFPFVAIAQGSDVHQYLRIPARREIISRLLPAASGVITRSAELARLLGDAGIPRDRLHPIYNGINLALFHPAEHLAIRRELRLPLDARIVLFVGNFVAIKNPVLLVQAIARLREDPAFANVLLVMIGGGPLEGEITFQASRGGMSECVMLAGRLAAPMVAKFMQAADVLCLPSDNEGVPNVILEAFATGRPVVASNVGGIAEVHNAPHLGRLVPPRDLDALVGALGGVLSELPDAGRIRAHGEQFTWQRAADAYHRVLSVAT
ncbi:MAG: glycosyltransferase [Chthoniobacteraceae bacterium]